MKDPIKIFSDGQVSAEVEFNPNIWGDSITDASFLINGNNYADYFEAAAYKNAIDYLYRNCKSKVLTTLKINYLLGQRSDRRFEVNKSFDLKIIADFINSMNFDNVEILDPHSDVTPALIKNYVDNDSLLRSNIRNTLEDIKTSFKINPPVILTPDAGAYKKYFDKTPTNIPILSASKHRSHSGEMSNVVPEIPKTKGVLIVDDIIDGGRTFMNIRKQLPEDIKVFLYASHGMFNYNTEELLETFDRIYTSKYCKYAFREVEGVHYL